MDDMRSLEQRIAAELAAMAGPEPPVDAMAVTRSVAAAAPRGRRQALFGGLAFVAGAMVLAAFAGVLLLSGFLGGRDDPDRPIIGASPSATAEPTPSPAPSASVEAALVDRPATAAYTFVRSGFDEPPRFELTGIAAAPSGAIVVSGNRFRDGDPKGFLWSSSDGGETWTRTTIDEVEWMADVRASGDGFAAYGVIGGDRDRAAVWTSEDGLTWTRRLSVGEADFSGLLLDTRGLGVLGALRRPAEGFERARGRDSYHTVVWTSDDAKTWQSSVVSPPLSPDDERQVERHGLARSDDGTMVVVGTRVIDDPEEPRFAITRLLLWRSEDGETWQSVDVPEAIAHRSSYPMDIVWTPAGFVLSVAGTQDDAGRLWTSTDGRAWEPIADQDAIRLRRIVTGGDTLLGMLGRRAYEPISRSADGRTWDPVGVSGASGTFTALTVAPDGRIIAAGYERQPGVDSEPGLRGTPFVWIGESSG